MTYHNPASILASGTIVWDTWRRDYPDVQAFEPNLHAVDLRHAQLQGIDSMKWTLRRPICRARIYVEQICGQQTCVMRICEVLI